MLLQFKVETAAAIFVPRSHPDHKQPESLSRAPAFLSDPVCDGPAVLVQRNWRIQSRGAYRAGLQWLDWTSGWSLRDRCRCRHDGTLTTLLRTISLCRFTLTLSMILGVEEVTYAAAAPAPRPNQGHYYLKLRCSSVTLR